ncbi:putative SAM-dependent methyltransferase Bucepa02006346 [Piscinibacter sakaiensis]|uniref:Putative SAM-dependent methyltransferase Bucepa02006346 n=1 Tax=Piscinibacter sakaiensis TaxID=1547922 RepID=A0A0K8P4H0_PISS1|nr:class I SAM-dependent methyltransferase [Piscinibacter sakaiensis]GAP37547.1 putative SAM-dependent methyltransferase Bucepa02006346 [Piscinibacter sakaiensis]
MPPPAAPALAPSAWVCRWSADLRAPTRVLDLACGSGRHVRWLAGRGHAVTAVDRDAAALAGLRGLAGVEALQADVEAGPWPLAGRRFDLVLVTNYLWRPLWPALRDSLADGGRLVCETFGVDQARIGRPSNPDFLLRPGELLAACAGLHVVAFEQGPEVDAQGRLLRHVQRIAALQREPAADDPARPRLSADRPAAAL